MPVGEYNSDRVLNTGLNLRYYNELTVTNRLEGNSFWGTLTFEF
ncbi:MAG: hypothetical protein WAU47_06930 [Desulfobaccales bacterium]